MTHWIQDEAYDFSDKYLVLSGGDVWSGPAISTWFKGEPMIETMNAMKYDAAALGNHEFDGKVDNLRKLSQQARFPFLAANISYKSNGEIPDFVKPYVVIERQGIKIGIIGLASLTTPETTFPANVADFNFTDYANAIKKYVPLARADGAEIILVIGHICDNEMKDLSQLAIQMNISFIGGAHCHQAFLYNANGLAMIQAKSYYKAYGKMVFTYSKTKKTVQIVSAEIKNNTPTNLNTDIAKIVDYWSLNTDSILDKPIGYSNKIIYKYMPEMANMITDSWLDYFPGYDVSITNSGGIRQDIPTGDITLKTIVGVLPFDNSIVELELTGEQLINCVKYYEIGGMNTINGYVLSNGKTVNRDSTYKVLTTDYLYSLTSNNFAKYDSTPYNTSVNFRDPVIQWIEGKESTEAMPINQFLDYQVRHEKK
jgi:2',3'-cyclic-nucleotide 2'-phosphodiesterase (5'-nucleotidase family)